MVPVESSILPERSFIAMEYYGLILNRTFRVTVRSSGLEGMVVRGLTAAESAGVNWLAKKVVATMAVRGDLLAPETYVDRKLVANKPPHGSDFFLRAEDITSVQFNPKRKWGMSYYPHDGRVLIRTHSGTREFIILGNQSGQSISDWIRELIDKGPTVVA